MSLPRFTQKRLDTYRFNPPQDIVDANVVKRCELGKDLATATQLARSLNKKIDLWRKGKDESVEVYDKSTVNQVINAYTKSWDFAQLRDKTQTDYQYFMRQLSEDIGNRKYKSVTLKDAKQIYNKWLNRGITFANHACSVSSRLFTYAVQFDDKPFNPFSQVTRKTPLQRKVVWTRTDVTKFLETAYAEFDTRNVGLIVQMAYEWVQRLGDMRLLEWTSIKDRQVHIKQSKRRAEVFLPISEELFDMLEQQRKDFGFQRYICPQIKPVQGEFLPYSLYGLSKKGRDVMRKAGLSDELRLMDIRRTGTTEMVDAGVSLGQIMSVTGHTNPSSVKPYMKNTFTSANNALTTRKEHVRSVYNG